MDLETPITTQEQLDAMVKDRLARNTAKVTAEVEARFADYDKLKESASQLDALKAENDKLKADEKARTDAAALKAMVDKVAAETKVDGSLLRGSTEDELRAHAEQIAKAYAKPAAPHLPETGTSASDASGGDNEDMRSFVRALTGRA